MCFKGERLLDIHKRDTILFANVTAPVGQSTDSIYETFSLKLSDLKVHADTFEQMMLSQLRNEGQIMDR